LRTKHPALDNAVWRKSNGSGDGNCVEVALTAEVVGMRDSKNPAGPALMFEPAVWSDFVEAIRRGEFEIAS